MKEYKKVWNIFFISQAEEEERWLNEMARNGWNFVRVQCLCRYVFKRGKPGEFIYKLDLPENMPHGLGKEEYYNFLTECGIRIVCDRRIGCICKSGRLMDLLIMKTIPLLN